MSQEEILGRPGAGQRRTDAGRRFRRARSSGSRPASAATSPTRSPSPWPRTTGRRTASRAVDRRRRAGAPRSRAAAGRAAARAGLRLRGHGPLPGDRAVPERGDGVRRRARAPGRARRAQGPRSRRQPDEPLPPGPRALLRRARTGRARSTPRSCTRSACRVRSAGGSPPARASRTRSSSSRACCSRPTRSTGCCSRSTRPSDARHENIMGTLLTMYSSANSIFPMRRKAGKESPGRHRPALPGGLRHGDPEPLLRGALGADAHQRVLRPHDHPRMRHALAGPGAAASSRCPARVLETAKWWADFRPGTGNLENWHPVPRIVPQTDEARRDPDRDPPRGRGGVRQGREPPATRSARPCGVACSEHARKLALLYAVSENHEHPEIGKAAAEWASRFVMHQTQADALHGPGPRRGQPVPRRVPEVPAEAARAPRSGSSRTACCSSG